MDFVIALVLLAVVIFSLGWVGIIPIFGPGPNGGSPSHGGSSPESLARRLARRRDRLERQMREVPDE